MNKPTDEKTDIPLQELAPAEVGEIDLYQKRERIYTRKIEGVFQRIRLFTGWPLLLGYFLVPWLSWNGHQLVHFDIPARKFHIFMFTFWPQDFNLLAWLLIIAAFGLFMVTTWVGRIWCGYTCPQTVWTSIFMWAEQVAEGTRNQRIKLDKQPWTAHKILKKALKHLMWLGFAFLTGLTFIGYFSPIRELVPAMLQLSANFWATIWIVFFALATYINAGWLREQVCIYMCPYARFQAVMFDKDTLIVAYDERRGEPRGARKKSADYKADGKGECIACELCVQVCPTGIDIREGLQYQCINCALCIDACNSVMEKMNYPKNLISYTSEHVLSGKEQRRFRPRVVGYAVMMLVMTSAFSYHLATRIPLELDIILDRNRLYAESVEGYIENIYTLRILNMDQKNHRYNLSVKGQEGIKLIGPSLLDLEAGEILSLPVRVRNTGVPIAMSQGKIYFNITATDNPKINSTEEARFLSPRS